MPIGRLIEIKTPDTERYQDDCLHPCIRYIPEGFAGHKWWMVQSPYYAGNSKVENPLLYYCDDGDTSFNWIYLGIVQETPDAGFNSDPMIYHESGKLWVFWREKGTPLCHRLNIVSATLGVSTSDGITYSKPKIFLTSLDPEIDSELCPILLKVNEKYCFYTSYYQFKPKRKGLGIAIWEGSSLENPNFQLRTISKTVNTFTCDKFKQQRIGNHLLFIPKPLKHDIWHFDLFEVNNNLYMISVSEWGDNIMLSTSEDYKKFRTLRTPLVNTHYSGQNYFYKPTGYVQDGVFHLFYTAKDNKDNNRNLLFHTEMNLSNII